jgi:hypothetical protein
MPKRKGARSKVTRKRAKAIEVSGSDSESVTSQASDSESGVSASETETQASTGPMAARPSKPTVKSSVSEAMIERKVKELEKLSGESRQKMVALIESLKRQRNEELAESKKALEDYEDQYMLPKFKKVVLSIAEDKFKLKQDQQRLDKKVSLCEKVYSRFFQRDFEAQINMHMQTREATATAIKTAEEMERAAKRAAKKAARRIEREIKKMLAGAGAGGGDSK